MPNKKFENQEKVENTESTQIIAARVLTAAVESPKIITGNYSALIGCLNEVLTNTVTIASDSEPPHQSPIHLIAEPMWLDSVDRTYDNEPWGQSIDAFPPAIQKFAQEKLSPHPEAGIKLTWGQVRELRSAMLESLKTAPGFTVYEGQIHKVEETPRVGSENEKELNIKFEDNRTVTIPFTGSPVVLDLSQRPRPGGSALSHEPTVLYRQSNEKNTETNDVPIFCAGSGAQAAWVLDKMDDKRTYNVIYRSTLDFRIANAILGRAEYTATKALVNVNESPLKEKLEDLKSGTLTEVTYTKDNGQTMKINIAVYPGNENSKLIKASEIPSDPREARAYLLALKVSPEDVDSVLLDISEQLAKREKQGLTTEQLAVQLIFNPLRVDVGFAVNATGWVSLKETAARGAPPFWGASAQVSTGDELLKTAKLVTTNSLLPGSGLPRMLALRSKLREMAGREENIYDVRTLAFTESSLERMCKECNFPTGFKDTLKKEIQQLGTPDHAKPTPVAWIIEKYSDWLDSNPPEPKEATVSTEKEEEKPLTKEELIQLAKEGAKSEALAALEKNVEQHETSAKGMTF